MKKQREKFKSHHFDRKAGYKDEHHLKPRSRGGNNLGSNLIELDAYKHSAWHLLFKNLTIDEIVALLLRLKSIKESQKMNKRLC